MKAKTDAMQISLVEELINQAKTLFEKEKNNEDRRFNDGEYYNIFDTLGLTTLEVRLHSAFIADLLNPQAAHGLGHKPLELFLSIIGEGSFCFDIKSAKTYVEYYIGKISESGETGGQIDILIEDKHHHAIIIENKIYAGDQQTQLLRYHNYATQHHKNNYRLLYLTLDGHSPSEYSTGNCDIDHHCISYGREISDWLSQCLEISADKLLINSVIKQYLTTLDGLMGRHSEEYSDKLASLLQKEEYIDSVLEILDNRGYVYDKIREDFIKALRLVAKEEGFEMQFDENIIYQKSSGASWIIFTSPVSDKWALFMGQIKCGGSIYYGISTQIEGNLGTPTNPCVEKFDYVGR